MSISYERLTKSEMIRAMKDWRWETELTENDSFEAIKAEYEEMVDTYNSVETALYPNKEID